MVKLLNNYPLTEVIIHPRLVNQQYKGSPDWAFFEQMLNICRHPVAANGDINMMDDYFTLKTRFPKVQRWMMGRGWLSNPSLAHEITNNRLSQRERNCNLLLLHTAYHRLILSQKQMPWQLQHQLLVQFWYYPSQQMENGKRWFRRLSKANKPEEYEQYIRESLAWETE